MFDTSFHQDREKADFQTQTMSAKDQMRQLLSGWFPGWNFCSKLKEICFIGSSNSKALECIWSAGDFGKPGAKYRCGKAGKKVTICTPRCLAYSKAERRFKCASCLGSVCCLLASFNACTDVSREGQQSCWRVWSRSLMRSSWGK